MIEVKHVTKSFDGYKALDDLTLTVPTGAVYGLVGPNGAGKSTILRHITGAYKPDGGEILFDGEPIWENRERKARIASLPDELWIYGSDSTRDAAKFAAGFYPFFDWSRFEALAEVFRAVPVRRPVRRLSRGMQKQSAFWVALCTHPSLLVLDEPVDGLDPLMRREIWRLLLDDVAAGDLTVLVSSHNLRELEDVADTVGIMKGGKLLLEKSLSSLQENLVKIQAVFPEGTEVRLPKGHPVLRDSSEGRVRTLIMRGRTEEIQEELKDFSPLFLDVLPLTLEEIFIYELGGEDYDDSGNLR